MISEELKKDWVSVGGNMLLGFVSGLFMRNLSVNSFCQGTRQSGCETTYCKLTSKTVANINLVLS